MDLLISVIIAGMVAGYVTELVAMLFDRPFLRLLTGLAASGVSLYFMGYYEVQLALLTLASAFVTASTLKLINRPVVINNSLRR
jgi:energy-converting hydrogenase Eha subunit E